ncbi:MAG TPA: hypothetical protein DDW62_01060 [Marinilabiliaceae bacterium]|nr:hypothetical protein [Marinilabiliaceae bacterium]
MAVAAIGGVGYVLLIEKIVDVTRKYCTSSAQIEGITGIKVEETCSWHLPGCGVNLFSIHQQVTAVEGPVGKVATEIVIIKTGSQILADLKLGSKSSGGLSRPADFYAVETQFHTGMIGSPVARSNPTIRVGKRLATIIVKITHCIVVPLPIAQ